MKRLWFLFLSVLCFNVFGQLDTLNYGQYPGDPDSDTLRNAIIKIDNNFRKIDTGFVRNQRLLDSINSLQNQIDSIESGSVTWDTLSNYIDTSVFNDTIIYIQSQIDTLPNFNDLDTTLQNAKNYVDNIFGDTVTFNAPFITDNGDTATLIKLNDSVCIVMNGDTARIDGSSTGTGGNPILSDVDATDTTNWGAFINSIAYGITSGDTANWNNSTGGSGSMTAEAINDSVNFKMVYDGNDTITLLFGENYFRPYELTNDTIVIDMTNAQEFATFSATFYSADGSDTIAAFVTTDGSTVYWADADSFIRGAYLNNTFIGRKNGDLWTKIKRDDTITIITDTEALYVLSGEIGNQNDSLINLFMSKTMTSAVKPQGDWNITKNYTDDQLVIDTVYSNSDTLKLQLTASVLTTDTLFVDYTKGDTLIYALVNDSVLQSFTDSSVTNNISEFTPASLSPDYYNSNTYEFDNGNNDFSTGFSDIHVDDYEIYLNITPDDGQPVLQEVVYGFDDNISADVLFLIRADGQVRIYGRGVAYGTDSPVFTDGPGQKKTFNVRFVSGIPTLYVDGELEAMSLVADNTPPISSPFEIWYGSRSGSSLFYNGQAQHFFIKHGSLSGSDRTNMDNYYAGL